MRTNDLADEILLVVSVDQGDGQAALWWPLGSSHRAREPHRRGALTSFWELDEHVESVALPHARPPDTFASSSVRKK
jgi:hypothetical protein